MIVNKQMGNYLVQPKHIEESKSEEIQYYVRDYRDFNFDEVKEKTSKMNLKMVKINANDYIEGVANNLYKNIDMWDLILLINGYFFFIPFIIFMISSSLYIINIKNNYNNNIDNNIILDNRVEKSYIKEITLVRNRDLNKKKKRVLHR